MTAKEKPGKKKARRRAKEAEDDAPAATSRAMWKGELVVGDERVAVKLHAAAQGREVSFRLLHREDLSPARQRSVHAVTGEEVDREEIQRAFEVEQGTFIVLDDDELEPLAPEASRDVEVLGWVEPDLIAEPFFERPYHLVPDGDDEGYLALVQAVIDSGRVGLARWVMRRKRYAGALGARDGRLLLTTLRRADQVVLLQGYEAPGGRALDAKERELAGQLVDALAGTFDPGELHEEYSRRVAELVEAKSKGKRPPRKRVEKREAPRRSLAQALRASLKKAGEEVGLA